MAGVLNNLSQSWQGMSLIQRVVLLGVLLACIGAVALLVGWAKQPDMAMLYSDLSPDEASKIVEKVGDKDVPYELRNGGTSIYVPREEVYSLRLSMASEGLPKGSHAGYRILDQEKIGASPFSQRVNYTRAIEGELAKTVELIEGVASARVHVVRPEAPIFAGKERKPSATVAVRMQPGRQLSAGNVAAVVHLVAGSVDGLTAGNVVVVDSGGNLLTREEDNELARGANTLLDYKTQVEQYLARKAEDMLATALGPNRASVRVSAVIDTSSLNETVESYDPDGQVTATETIESSESTSPGAAGGGSEGGGGSTSEEKITTEYKVGRTVRQQQEMPGKIESLSVAAFVDLSPAKAEGEEGGGEDAAAAPVIAIEDAEQIIRNALGLASDAPVKVVNTPFHAVNQPSFQPPADEGGLLSLVLEIARRSSLGILVIGALIALKIFTGKSKSGEGTAALEREPSEEQNYLPGGEGEEESDRLRQRITRALQDNPEEVKRLFLSWVKTEEGG